MSVAAELARHVELSRHSLRLLHPEAEAKYVDDGDGRIEVHTPDGHFAARTLEVTWTGLDNVSRPLALAVDLFCVGLATPAERAEIIELVQAVMLDLATLAWIGAEAAVAATGQAGSGLLSAPGMAPMGVGEAAARIGHLEAASAELAAGWTETEAAFDAFVGDVLANAPEQFVGGPDSERDALGYVRWLEAQIAAAADATVRVRWDGPDGQTLATIYPSGTAELATRPESHRVWGPPLIGQVVK